MHANSYEIILNLFIVYITLYKKKVDLFKKNKFLFFKCLTADPFYDIPCSLKRADVHQLS